MQYGQILLVWRMVNISILQFHQRSRPDPWGGYQAPVRVVIIIYYFSFYIFTPRGPRVHPSILAYAMTHASFFTWSKTVLSGQLDPTRQWQHKSTTNDPSIRARNTQHGWDVSVLASNNVREDVPQIRRRSINAKTFHKSEERRETRETCADYKSGVAWLHGLITSIC